MILLDLIYSDRVRFDVRGKRIPFLVFDYVITTHQFFPSEYLKPLSKDREKLHQETDKLHQQGWGYTKIHHHLVKNELQLFYSMDGRGSIPMFLNLLSNFSVLLFS